MKFSELSRFRPKGNHNVFVFVCDDDFLVEESRAVWSEILGGGWVFEKFQVREFEEIGADRLMDEALTPSLFSTNRALLVANAEKVTKRRTEDLAALDAVPASSLKVLLVCSSGKTAEGMKSFPVVTIDPLKPAEVARWLMDRHGVAADVARYVVESVGTELHALHGEMEKLKTYVGGARPVTIADVDACILRTEKFGPFELDDAILARDYSKAVVVVGTMLDDGVEPLMILGKITRVWRQLFVGKGIAGRKSAGEVAAAAGIPNFKAGAFAAACRNFAWPRLAGGFRELLAADRAFKSSSPKAEAYFDIMLWKLLGS